MLHIYINFNNKISSSWYIDIIYNTNYVHTTRTNMKICSAEWVTKFNIILNATIDDFFEICIVFEIVNYE